MTKRTTVQNVNVHGQTMEEADRAGDCHKGLPVAGYLPQSDVKVRLVNEAKAIEELAVRQAERLDSVHFDDGTRVDPRLLALARTHLQIAFMFMNRAVFQPGRVSSADVLAFIESQTLTQGRS